METWLRDLPAFLMVGAILFFFVFMAIKSRVQEKKRQDKEKGGKP